MAWASAAAGDPDGVDGVAALRDLSLLLARDLGLLHWGISEPGRWIQARGACGNRISYRGNT